MGSSTGVRVCVADDGWADGCCLGAGAEVDGVGAELDRPL